MGKRKATPAEPERRVEGITNITVEGFKSLAKRTSVDIRPLTILAGANSSGKSSIMQPLLLMKQTLEAPLEPAGPLRLSGPNARYTSVDQILSDAGRVGTARSFSVSLSLGRVGRCQSVFSRGEGGEPVLQETVVNRGDGEVRLHDGMTLDEILMLATPSRRPFRPVAVGAEEVDISLEVARQRCFMDLRLVGTRPDGTRITSPWGSTAEFAAELQYSLHVPGLRGHPERTYEATAAGPLFSGTFEGYTAGVIHAWQLDGDARCAELGRHLQALGLTWRVEARPVLGTQVELLVGRLPRRTDRWGGGLVNIADVGFGVSQVLPVLVALLAAEPGQLVYVEQPELHLHPRAQIALAGILAEAAKRGVRLVAETHSSLLLLAVQTLVAEGVLPEKDVVLHWFKRSANGVTKVSHAELDAAGRFGDWPEDFGEVELRAHRRYLDAGEAALEAESDA